MEFYSPSCNSRQQGLMVHRQPDPTQPDPEGGTAMAAPSIRHLLMGTMPRWMNGSCTKTVLPIDGDIVSVKKLFITQTALFLPIISRGDYNSFSSLCVPCFAG